MFFRKKTQNKLNISDTDNIKIFSKKLIEEISPDEISLFDITSKEFFKNPKLFSNPKKLKKQELSAGVIIEGVTALTPFILITVKATYDFLKPKIVEYFNNKATIILEKEIDNVFSLLDNKEETIIDISSDDLIEIHSIIRKELSIYELPEKDVQIISDAIIGKISIHKKK